MPEIRLGAQAYFYREAGSGSMPIHFIHCTLASGKSWMPLADLFEHDARMTAIDLPAHGRSAPTLPGEDLHATATQASVCVLEQATRPVHLVGHSFGATVALRIAVERPDLVKSLVLFEPVLFSILAESAPEVFERETLENIDFAGFLRAGDHMAAVAHFVTRWGLPGEWQKIPQQQKQAMAAKMGLVGTTIPVLHGGSCRSLHLDQLAGITLPVIVVRGAASPNVMGHVSSLLCQTIPGTKSFSVAGAGHMVPLTHVAPSGAIMRDFLGLEPA